jgi:glycerophosphoryl diester phosphodiesterase
VDLKHGFVGPDDDRLEKTALEMIVESGMVDQVVVSSWDQVALSRIRAFDPEIPLAVNLRPRVPDPVGQVRPTGASWVAVWWPQVDRQTVAQLQAAGLRVCLVNLFTADYADALCLGVDAVTAEDPSAARAALAARREGQEHGTIHG